MKIFFKEIVEHIENQKSPTAQLSLMQFEHLCDKSKEIMWQFFCFNESFLIEDTLSTFYGLTPIEQIFNAVLVLYNYVSNESFYFCISPQVEIKIENRLYIADFYCESFILGGVEWELDKKIVIECDGYESHHTKEQRNRDTYRENDLKLNGHSVIRFTGSQLYNKPFECLLNSLIFIFEENKECIKKAFYEVKNNGKI